MAGFNAALGWTTMGVGYYRAQAPRTTATPTGGPTPTATTTTTPFTPATTWQQHEQQVTQALQNANPGANIGRQVTLDVTSGTQTARIRIDNTVPTPSGRFQLVDAKFSGVQDLTTANLSGTVTPNQTTVYGWIRNGSPITVVPRGANAAAAGFTPGVPIVVEPNVQMHVNSPTGIVVRNF
jgi:hypothetical protein